MATKCDWKYIQITVLLCHRMRKHIYSDYAPLNDLPRLVAESTSNVTTEQVPETMPADSLPFNVHHSQVVRKQLFRCVLSHLAS
jgi:hypothetical protein